MSAGTRTRRYAFVTPRFGEMIAGGAETLCRELALRLAARGDSVEVLTTTARDNRTWEHFFPEGESVDGGVVVRRFAVSPRDLEQWIPLQIGISQGMLYPVADQLTWMAESVNSNGLYSFIAQEQHRFDSLFFAPYLFGTTFWGSLLCPERAVLIPCLHDEHYAYVDIIQSMFRQVRGCLFNAVPEQELAEQLYGPLRGAAVGMGFVPPSPAQISALQPYFADHFPYLLYVGRKETGKNAHLLIDHFVQGKDDGILPAELRLVIAGGGSFSDLHRPAALTRGDVIDLDHVSELEKQRLIRHAVALAQPSTNESFSIVLMEAWMLGTPVLVSSAGAVTRYHVMQSGGGLYFSDTADLAGATRALIESPQLRFELGAAGAQYVAREFSWEAVLSRFDVAMSGLEEAR